MGRFLKCVILEALFKSSALLTGLVGLHLVLDLSPAKAQVPAVGSSGSFINQATRFEKTLPPEWNIAQSQGVANIFSSCGGMMVPVQNLASGIAAGAATQGGLKGLTQSSLCPMAVGASVLTTCPGSDTPPDTSQLSCDTAGQNPHVIDMMKNLIQQAECTNQCKRNKLQAVMAEINCISTQASNMANQIGMLTQYYNDNIQAMQKQVGYIKSIQEDRTNQLKEVTQKLMGDGDGGTEGLLNLKNRTLALVGAMPAQIQQIRAEYLQTVQSEKSLREDIQVRTMALTMNCFNTKTVADYTCEPNGPPVSPRDYLVCRFQQNQNLGANGVIENNATTRAQAKGAAAKLASVLDQIKNGAPSNPDIPASQEERNQSIRSSYKILSVDKVEAYKSTLSKFKVANSNAYDFVMGTLKNCNQTATGQTQSESERASSIEGTAQHSIKLAKQKVQDDIHERFTAYSQQYSDNLSGLIGQNVPLTDCTSNGAPVTQIKCLDGIRQTMKSLLEGSGENTKMTLTMKGVNPETNFSFECKGLNGCVTSYQNVSRNLKTEQASLENAKKVYIQSANQSTETFTRHIASQLNGQSQMLSNMLSGLSTALSSLGVGGINLPDVRGEPRQYDKDGLVKPPNNVLNLVGQYVNPPMKDLSGGGLSSVLSGLSQTQSRLESNYSQLNSNLIQISTLSQTCQMRDAQNRMQGVIDLGYAAQNCHSSDHCKGDKLAKLEEAVANIQNFASGSSLGGSQGFGSNQFGSGISSTTAAGLQSGFQTACEPPDPSAYETVERVEKVRGPDGKFIMITDPTTGARVPKTETIVEVKLDRNNQPVLHKEYMWQNRPQGCSAYFSTILGTSKALDNTLKSTNRGGFNSGSAFGP